VTADAGIATPATVSLTAKKPQKLSKIAVLVENRMAILSPRRGRRSLLK
jgi:hypothetical protein